jgi:hypothetical protein
MDSTLKRVDLCHARRPQPVGPAPDWLATERYVMRAYYSLKVIVTLLAAIATLFALSTGLTRSLLFVTGDGIHVATWRPSTFPDAPPLLVLAHLFALITGELVRWAVGPADHGTASLVAVLCSVLTFYGPTHGAKLWTCYVWLVRLLLPLSVVVLFGVALWAVVDRIKTLKAKGPLPDDMRTSFIVYDATAVLLLIATTVSMWVWWDKEARGQPFCADDWR